MLSIASVKSASGSAAYFAADNYYTIGEGTENSAWFGEGASELGLGGGVTKDAFEKILNGFTASGEQVGIAGKRRLGLDLTFSTSKSASVLALVGKDQRLIDAFVQSVKDTLKFVEQNLVQARTEQNGKFVPTDTKKLVAALFTHDTSRAQEPGLHVHAIIANMTQDKDGKWRALHNDKIWEYQSLIGNVQASFFRDAVEKLGYQTERTGKHGQFEIVGVPQDVKDAFSTRRAEILAKAGELGITTPQGFDAVTVGTRKNKDAGVDRVGLAASWLATSKGLGFDPLSLVEQSVAARAAPTKFASVLQTFHDLKAKFDNLFKPRDPLVDSGVGFTAKSPVAVKEQFVTASAIRMLSEREAGFERLDVVRAALSLDERGVGPQAVLNRIDSLVEGGLVVAGIGRAATQITTPEAVSRERNILRQVDIGRGAVTPTLPADIAYAALERLTSARPLNVGQLEAGVKILSSSDRIVQVQGIAGAGKSTLFAALGQALQVAGVGVEGTAFANKMVNDLKNGSAIDSRTVHGFLNANQRYMDGVAL
jgi:conjugative relaxase-like TrwC/TraI family protein